MHIRLINPNTTRSVTEKIARTAERVAAPTTRITACQPDSGPVSIECRYDEAFAVPGVLQAVIRAEADGVDAHIVACFGDPGVAAAREIARAPVLGVAEAAMHMACLVAPTFSIVTSVPRTIPSILELVQACGFGARCRRISAAEVEVLELEEDGSAEARVREACRRAAAEDECGAIVLGCSGMSHLAAALELEVGLPVVDGVAAAVKLAEAIVGLGMRPSKAGPTAFPGPKLYQGLFADFSPTHLVHGAPQLAKTRVSPAFPMGHPDD